MAICPVHSDQGRQLDNRLLQSELAELDSLKAGNYRRFDTAMAIMICNDEAREYSTGPMGVCGTSSQREGTMEVGHSHVLSGARP
jgi:hypothetical protein